MKKTTLINSDISRVISLMGHTDTIAIGDMGLPIPDGIERIDLALKLGTPTLEEVLRVILSELQVESYTIAEEASEEFKKICDNSFDINQKTIKNLCFCLQHSNDSELITLDSQYDILLNKPLPSCTKVSHEDFKKQLKNCKAVIRTGENKPYYNIILSSNVTF